MKPKQFFLVLLGIIGVMALAGGGGYYWALKQLKAQSAKLATDLASQVAADSQITYLSRLKSDYDKHIVPIIPMLEKDLPRDKQQTEILAQLKTLAAQSGLAIGSVNMPSPLGLPTAVSQTVKAGNVLALPISFQLSGAYDQLQNFMGHVENLNRFTNVTNLGISRPDKSRPIIYTIALNAYIKP